MLRIHNLPDHDPLINDMFIDFDDTIFPWMSDGFDQLPDANVSNDDLLTDAVSEIFKSKTELPYPDFHNSSDDLNVVVCDEVEMNETLLVNPTEQADQREHQVDSSGYTSGTVSSTYLSPSNSTSSQVASPLSVDLAQPNNVPNTGIQISSDGPIQRKNIIRASLFKRSDETEPPIITSKRTFNKRELTPGNRVHLILHHNPSSIKLNNKVIHSNGSDAERGKIGVVYLNKSRSQQSDIVYPCSDGKRFTESPMFSASHSSSDSDMKDNSDDDQITNLSYSKYQETCGHENTSQPRNSTNFTGAVSSFKRMASPLSKFPNFKYGYDEETGYNYPQTARIMSQNLFRSQLSSSRIRSPVRLDRNDPGLLMLTSEEKRTLIAEGYTIPTRLPLTKQEERNLKKVRRKIKNKISAQESRRKKKEYLEALERKVSVYSQDNVELRRRVDSLENTNRSLLGQLRLLQQLVNKSKSLASSNNSTSLASAKPSISLSANPQATSGHKSSTGGQQCTPGNGSVSAATAASAAGARAASSGGSESGPSSTCLMVFALCFVALLVGQPLQPVSQSNTGTALSSASSQIFTLRLLGSTSQVGYSWSPPGHRSKGQPDQHHLFQSTWLARQYFHWMGSGQLRHHEHFPASTCAVDGDGAEPAIVGGQAQAGDGMTESGSLGAAQATRQIVATGTVSQPTVIGEWKLAEPRSRLLGSPSELAECSAPPRRSFWSYLFGGLDSAGSSRSTLGGICTQLEYVATGGDDDTGLDSVSRNWLPELATFSAHPKARQQLNRSKAAPQPVLLRSDADRHVTNLSNAVISSPSSSSSVMVSA